LSFDKVESKKVQQTHYRPRQALRVPGVWSSQISRQSVQGGGKFVSPTHRLTLLSGNIPGTQPQGHSAAGMIMSKKKSSDTIGNGNRDLPTCSAVPQPYALPRAPDVESGANKTVRNINLQAPCVLYIGQAFRYAPENAFYIFNQQCCRPPAGNIVGALYHKL
jgi:hypothetical protein